MRKNFKPLQFISYWGPHGKESPPQSWMEAMVSRPAYQYDLPTEVVLLPNARTPTPTQGRAWHAPDAFGTDTGSFAEGSGTWESCRYFIEVMENNGDDGHVEYACIGWALITADMMQEFVAAVNECSHFYDYPCFITESE